MLLIGKKAPDFKAAAVLEDGSLTEQFSLHETLAGEIGILFFYPLDFTFVCPSELIALEHRIERFRKLNANVIGVSIDSQYTHLAWQNTPVSQGGVGKLSYPLVADVTHQICRDYGVEHPEAGVAVRASFLIDKAGLIRHYVVNDLPLGRNIDEMLRMVEALQFHEAHGEVCPAQWTADRPGMQASSEGVKQYLQKHGEQL